MLFAIIGTLASSVMSVFDKIILDYKRLTYKQLLPVSLTTTFVICLFAFPFLGQISPKFFALKYEIIFALEICTAFFLNIFFFYSMKREELCDIEPFVLMDGPLTVILAALLFPSERNLIPLVLTLIAAFALVLSRVKKHHFRLVFKKTTLALMAYVILSSFESQFAKVLLEVLSPVALYAIRTGFLATLFWVFLKPRLARLPMTQKRNLAIDGAISFIVFISRFYAIMYIGIVQSTLIFLLAPVLTLGFSKFYLKENLTFRKISADIIIIACVAVTLLTR